MFGTHPWKKFSNVIPHPIIVQCITRIYRYVGARIMHYNENESKIKILKIPIVWVKISKTSILDHMYCWFTFLGADLESSNFTILTANDISPYLQLILPCLIKTGLNLLFHHAYCLSVSWCNTFNGSSQLSYLSYLFHFLHMYR